MADPVSIGINIAIQFAIQLAIAALTPKQNTEGPRLDDLSVTTSTYGNTRPIGYGTVKTSGNIIWGRDIEEVAEKVEIGKGNPFSLGTNTVYSYFATFATALFNRKAERLIKIYADGKVIYDAEKNEKMKDLSFRFYNGSDTQEPDSIIEEDYPDGEVPGYRGTCYVVFNRLPLENFGNRIPQMQFVVSFSEKEAPAKAVIPRDGGTSYPGLPVLNTGPTMIDYVNRVFWFVHGTVGDGGNLSMYDMETGQVLRTISEAEFKAAADEFYALVDVEKPLADQIRLFDAGIQGSPETDCPYLLLTKFGSGTQPCYVLDKWTFEILGVTSDGFGAGGHYVSNPGSNDDEVYVDPSGDAVIVSVAGATGSIHWLLGSHDGIVTNNWTDGVFRPQKGLSATYSLPDMIITEQGNLPITGRGMCKSLTRTYKRIGQTQVIGFHDSGPTGGFAQAGLVMIRYFVNTFGELSYEELTIDGLDGVRTEVNIDQTVTTTGWTASARYDPQRDILVCTLDNGGSGYANAFSCAFFLNSDNSDSSLGVGQVRELWRTPMLEPLGTVEYAIEGQSAELDGTFVSTRAGAYDIHSVETGERLERVLFNPPYFDVNGASIDTTQAPTVDMQYWDSSARRILNTYAFNDVGWIFIDPPAGRGTESLRTVVEDIVLRSKLTLSDIDASELAAKQVRGYIISGDMSYRAAVEPLATVYNFYGVENAGTLEFKFKDEVTDLVIPEDDLVTDKSGIIQYEEVRGQEIELPKALYVEYFQQGDSDTVMVQGAYRNGVPVPVVGSLGEVRYQFPMVLSDDEAIEAANRILYETWVGQEQITFRLPQTYLDILPNDVLDVTANNRRDNLRVEKVGVGSDLSVQVEGRVIDGSIYDLSFTAAPPIGSSGWGRIETVIGQPMTALFGAITDAPFPADEYAERDRTYGSLYLTFAGSLKPEGAFRDTSFLVSLNGGSSYASKAVNEEKISWGQLSGVMPPPPSNNFNGIQRDFTIDMTIIDGADNFSSTTDALMLQSDANAAMIYNPSTGVVEYVNFQEVTVLGTSKVRLSNFLRGKRGTDVMAQEHTAGAYLILMTTDTISGFWEILANNGIDTLYKPVNIDIVENQVAAKAITYQHKALKPYAPTGVEAVEDSNGITLSWIRRGRLGAASTLPLGGEVPLSEDTESYEVDILDGPGGAVLRTLTSGTESVVYDIDDVIYDFGVGGVTQPFYVKVYQISAQVGRGFGHEWALTT